MEGVGTERRRRARSPGIPLVVCLVMAAALAGAPSPAAVVAEANSLSENGGPAIDWAWRFASSIQGDDQSAGGAQRAVLEALLKAGQIDEAVRRSAEVIGWQRGVAYADLAAALARDGRTEEARGLIDRAEEVRRSVGGWQNPRISMHIGSALAAMGETGEASKVLRATAEKDPGEYSGQVAATLAAAQIDTEGFEQAMATLAARPVKSDFHDAWWRTRGYLDLGQRSDLSHAQRLRALQEAVASVEKTVGTRKLDLMKGITEAYHALGETKKAHASLETVEQWVLESAAKSPTGSAQIAELARTWREFGEPKRARTLLVRAENAVNKGTVTERPTLYAKVASGYRLIGDEKKAGSLYALAFEATDQLQSARPRALSAVAVCLSLAADQAIIDAGLEGRLQTLLGGLQVP